MHFNNFVHTSFSLFFFLFVFYLKTSTGFEKPATSPSEPAPPFPGPNQVRSILSLQPLNPFFLRLDGES